MLTNVRPELIGKMVAWRRDFHRHPELAYQEQRTAGIVAKVLCELGYEVHTGIAETGIVALRKFGEGPNIAIRADMDALPIHEENDNEFCSQVPGIMHACGHDAHTAMAMGAAEMLANRSDLSGTVTFIFQPAEENEGGAKAMVDADIFDRFAIEEVYALHNMPQVPVGTALARSGAVSASFDTFEIEVKGEGGHGAMPRGTRDALVAAAALVGALNTVISRALAPLEAGVLTIGSINSGDAFNVIPANARLKGSCRSLDADVQARLKQRIEQICAGIAKAYDVEVDCSYESRYPAVVNAERASDCVINALRKVNAIKEVETDFPPFMGSEDFSFMLQERPGCYFVIGIGDDTGALHSPTYNFNETALPIGASAFASIVQERLG